MRTNKSTWLLLVTAALILARWDGLRPSVPERIAAPDESAPPEPLEGDNRGDCIGEQAPRESFFSEREFNLDLPGKSSTLKLLSVFAHPQATAFQPVHFAEGETSTGKTRRAWLILSPRQTRAPPLNF